ncbi:proteasome subunit alpha type-7-1B [Drosophila simulans]|uniref:Proteasome subunit alpha type n=1 Tax=Drosophila simulans TaxID=7240 RepID=Q6QH09_DROSI|nr:proteasome subunit alpha type-7-1B [Drosophila simulans]AAS86225.1 testes-specific alpha4-t2 proteasome subunit [Drosophila melanogaster]AAS86224.1 testes-specific alpha4-t2 proteasome subunit [Drosophila simulans]AAS86226.1 testes-specific alpha4-t2 proteasome subunit [Drosophila melanogaster]AAS86227.1 testes-specific alpha4-t2 proteasome subunit [Drosophila simulans]EDX08559.1 Pros28.1B [Drosophila simulans]
MAQRYDRAVTIYSPDGHLLQVEYAQEAVRRGSTVMGLRTNNAIVLGVEKRSVGDLQEERMVRKICMLDDHVVMTFSGLTADARILVSRAQMEAQSHRLNFEKPTTVEYITRYIAQLKQNYTQSNGRRPFGLSCLVGGFDEDGTPHLFQTDPSGIFYEWRANTTGRSSQPVRDYMEKHADEILTIADEAAAVKHIVRTLVSVSSLNHTQMEVAELKYRQPLRMIDHQVLADLERTVRREIEAEAEASRRPRAP